MTFEIMLVTGRVGQQENLKAVAEYDNAADAVKYIFLKLSFMDGEYKIFKRIDGCLFVVGHYYQYLDEDTIKPIS